MTKLFRRVFIPDCHFPNHDEKAFSLCLSVVKDFKPDEIVVLGDFQDCETVSNYTKDPKSQYKLLEAELEEGRNGISRIMGCARGASLVYLSGNHENRIDRYVAQNAAALGGSINTKDVLKLPNAWKFYPYGGKWFHRCGPKLIATHGSIYNRHVCASMVQKYGTSVVFGHVHRIQEFHIKNIYGQDSVAFTPGWLGDEKSASYIQDVADWSHGFAIAWFKPSGDFFHQIIQIKNHELVFEGKLYHPHTL